MKSIIFMSKVKSTNDLKIGDTAYFRSIQLDKFIKIEIVQADIDQIKEYKDTYFEDYWYKIENTDK